MSTLIEHREELGKRLGEITQRVRAEKRAALIRERGEVYFQGCRERALEAAKRGEDAIDASFSLSDRGTPPVDVIILLEAGKWAADELVRCGCRAVFSHEALREPDGMFLIRISWDVPPVVPEAEPLELTDAAVSAPPPERLVLKEQHPCEKCAAKHAESGLGDRYVCHCTCHVFSNPRLSPVAV